MNNKQYLTSEMQKKEISHNTEELLGKIKKDIFDIFSANGINKQNKSNESTESYEELLREAEQLFEETEITLFSDDEKPLPLHNQPKIQGVGITIGIDDNQVVVQQDVGKKRYYTTTATWTFNSKRIQSLYFAKPSQFSEGFVLIEFKDSEWDIADERTEYEKNNLSDVDARDFINKKELKIIYDSSKKTDFEEFMKSLSSDTKIRLNYL